MEERARHLLPPCSHRCAHILHTKKRVSERDRQRERERESQTGTQTQRKGDRQRHAHSYRGGEEGRREIDTYTLRDRHIYTEGQRHREKDK